LNENPNQFFLEIVDFQFHIKSKKKYNDAWIFLYFEKKLIWFFIHSLSISELKEVEHRQNGKHYEECWNVP